MLAAAALRELVDRLRDGDAMAEEVVTCASEKTAPGIGPGAFTDVNAGKSSRSSAAERIPRSSTQSARRSPKSQALLEHGSSRVTTETYSHAISAVHSRSAAHAIGIVLDRAVGARPALKVMP